MFIFYWKKSKSEKKKHKKHNSHIKHFWYSGCVEQVKWVNTNTLHQFYDLSLSLLLYQSEWVNEWVYVYVYKLVYICMGMCEYECRASAYIKSICLSSEYDWKTQLNVTLFSCCCQSLPLYLCTFGNVRRSNVS